MVITNALYLVFGEKTHTMKNKELDIIKELRENAREKLTKMSRKTSIPVSTIFEYLKGFENNVIKKHTCLIDFRKLGYDLRVTLLVKATQDHKDSVRNYLQAHHQVNTVYRINNGFDYLAEVLFTNMSQLQQFLDELDERGIKQRQEYYVLEEIRQEAFLTSQAHLDLLKTATQ